MKTRLFLPFILAVIIFAGGCATPPEQSADADSGATLGFSQSGNSLYHKTGEVPLTPGTLAIGGEVREPGQVDFTKHYKREVMIKETVYDVSDGIKFTGVYRYKGYSLFDILNDFVIEKKNAELFPPAIDAYIVVENDKGESVSFSWSEIFHTNIPHQVLIATEMAPIEPHKIEVDYPVKERWTLVSADDLFAFRMLDNPVKITVYSFDKKDYPVTKGMSPMFQPTVKVMLEDREVYTITAAHAKKGEMVAHTNFYGMGRGNHQVDNLTGPSLPGLLKGVIEPFDARLNRSALVCFAAKDGYRAVYSYSEIFNRTDQSTPMLALTHEQNEGGLYRNFMPHDFFADRSVKGLMEIYIFLPR